MRFAKVLIFFNLLLTGKESALSGCYLESLRTEDFSVHGNIIIGIITFIHARIQQPDLSFQERPQDVSCQGFMIRYYREVLAMMFAIEEINRDSQLLPNVTLGFQVHDSCASESRAIQGAMSLLWQKQKSEPSRYSDCHAWPPLAGIVGDSASALSVPIARILGLYNIPQIPRSVCSENCLMGHRKVAVEGRPACCFECVPCSGGEITTENNPSLCQKCPEDQWPNENQDQCLPRQPQFLSYEEAMGAALAVAAITFSLLALLVLIIFRRYAETPVVKANNRNLSYLLLIALVWCFLSVLLFIGHPVRVTCLLRQTVFGITFSITVSCMLAKTVTVIVAFKSTRPNLLGKKLGSKFTSFIVLFCPVVQVLICIIWLVTSPPFPERNMKSQSNKIVIQCNEGSPLLFYGMLGYLGVLATVSFIVAFLARKLPDSFNEGKFITFSMFVFLSVWLSFIPAYLSAEGKYVVVVEIFAILASGAGLLSCLFFPKCYIILFRPDMNTKQYVRGKQAFNEGRSYIH